MMTGNATRQPAAQGDGSVRLLVGDARSTLAGLPDSSVDCIVTSPPYWGLRDYGTGHWSGGASTCRHRQAAPILQRHGKAGTCPTCGARWNDPQYGLEPALSDYIGCLRDVFTEARRVLAPDGTCWLNVGDSYASGEVGRADATTSYPSLAAAQKHGRMAHLRQHTNLPRKNLLGIPWRLAFALQDDGWWLRSCVIWSKPNAMPESVTDRPSVSHEYLFLFTRSARYWFNLDPIRRPTTRADRPSVGGTRKRNGILGSASRTAPGASYRPDDDTSAFLNHPDSAYRRATSHQRAHPHGANPGSVWRISTRPCNEAHFATFPIDIPLRCIAAGCKPDGVVCDPFSGAGTTGMAARQLGHPYLGIDISADYHDIANERILRQMQQLGMSTDDGRAGGEGV
jgi:DNA modification methylase